MNFEKINGENNTVTFRIGDEIIIDCLIAADEKLTELLNRSNIIVIGNNNRISLSFKKEEDIEPLLLNKGFNLLIVGDNNVMEIGTLNVGYMPDWNMRGLHLKIGGFADNWTEPGINRTANNCHVRTGNNVMICGAIIYLQDDNSELIIGDDCMISWGVDIWCTDVHTIMDEDGNPKNFGRYIELGKHVWIGKDSKIGKNVRIADNCIIGWGSIVTKGTEETNVILAGNPAKIIKRNIDWNSRCINRYVAYIGNK